jgi:translation initiation factor IF-2
LGNINYMNISTLAKVLGVSVTELKEVGVKNKIYGFNRKNTRINYNSALEITKIMRPDKLKTLKNDDNIYIAPVVTVLELAEAIDRAPGMVIRSLMMNGVMATLNEKIDFDTASLIAEELGTRIAPENSGNFEQLANGEGQDLQMMKTFDPLSHNLKEGGKLVTRPPVVTVMGHVDHGKTTLLDTIRKTNVVSGEAGAITQHISSYQIEYVPQNAEDKNLGKNLIHGKKGVKITFVDTPGHAAFTSMRARGTQLADIIILMVSAVEGCKPQTIEVIDRAKMSKTPVIVALNKIDLPNTDIDRVTQEVAGFGLVPEEWGGDTPFIQISAKNNLNIDKLLNRILLEAEVRELKGIVDVAGEGVVVETVSDPKTGIQVTVLITKGKLKVGDIIVCGGVQSKIKRLLNSDNKTVQSADITEPITIYGPTGDVNIGDMLVVYPSVKNASNAIAAEKLKQQVKKTYIHNIDASRDTLNIILKADVAGSLEALKESILKIPQEQTTIVIKSESVGQVNETDVEFASTTDSVILAFHTSIASSAITPLKANKINIISSDIIYEILEWCEEQIVSRIKHDIRTEILGRAEVIATFKSEKNNIQIFGGEVKSGKMLAIKSFRLVRDGEVIDKLELKELQRNKSKVNEVNITQQFGCSFTTKHKVQKGDLLECIEETIIKKTLR